MEWKLSNRLNCLNILKSDSLTSFDWKFVCRDCWAYHTPICPQAFHMAPFSTLLVTDTQGFQQNLELEDIEVIYIIILRIQMLYSPNHACWSPWTSIARPKSANLTAAPLALLASSKFSGCNGQRIEKCLIYVVMTSHLKISVNNSIGVAMVDRLEDLLDAVGSVRFRVELSGHNVLEELSTGHPDNNTIRQLALQSDNHYNLGSNYFPPNRAHTFMTSFVQADTTYIAFSV